MVDRGVTSCVVRVHLHKSFIMFGLVARYTDVKVFREELLTSIAMEIDIRKFLAAKFAYEIAVSKRVNSG